MPNWVWLALTNLLLSAAPLRSVDAEVAKKGAKGLRIEVISRPARCHIRSRVGDKLSMHYDGYLMNGKKFDSSRERGHVFQFILGQGTVIKGWDMGLLDMCISEKRKLIIHPQLGYGDAGANGVIPKKATLVFDVELLAVNGKDGRHQHKFGRHDT